MSQHDHSGCNHDHDHADHAKAHSHDDHAHDHDHDHVEVDPGEVIAEQSPQDRMLIGICAIAMTLLMICMGTWMQIAQPSGGGHNEHAEHAEHAEHTEHPAAVEHQSQTH